MNVLSLFDGISCGRVALERAGIPVNTYYASEIDKWAEKISEKNYPDIIRLGDVTKWKEWDIDFSKIDLVLAGSPCVSFSNAGKKGGFADDRGALFYVFCDILNHIQQLNPEVQYLFENVRMKREHEDTISGELGTPPLKIDSRLLSPLSRPRLYWSSFLWQPIRGAQECSICEMCNEPFCEIHQEHYADCLCIGPTEEPVQYLNDHWAARLPESTDMRIGDIMEDNHPSLPWLSEIAVSRLDAINRRAEEKGLGYKDCILTENDVFLNLDANFFKGPDGKRGVILQSGGLRMPSPLECERMMGLDDDYTAGVSNTQRYKAIGNGWSVDVITFLLGSLKR